ncbi:MAG: ribbon-helix-helix protein, CopG family [Gammaproteobacteria bacterium]|nr:ribbon-helix-helix protein, CopG family [Gammaproteobacteria bacterium]
MPRFTVELSDEINDTLDAIARRSGISKAEAMRRAFALLAIADQEKQKNRGRSLGIIREREDHSLEAVCRIIGV